MKERLTPSDIDKVFSCGFVHFDVSLSDVMFMPFQSKIPMFLAFKPNQCFTITATLLTQAKSDATPKRLKKDLKSQTNWNMLLTSTNNLSQEGFRTCWKYPPFLHDRRKILDLTLILFNIKTNSWNLDKTEFFLVWFYGISTIVGYLMSNQVYSYILDIYDL